MNEPQEILEFNNLDEFLHEALKNGDTLTTPKERQMLINITGVSVNAKPRRDGRYQGYVTKPDGNKQYFYGRTLEEVVAKIKLYLQEAKTPKRKIQQKYSPTFGEYVNKWLEIYKKPELKPTTITNITDCLKPAMMKFEMWKVANITSDDVQELLTSISASSIRSRCKNYLNQIFIKAVHSHIIKNNPCDVVEIKKHKYKHKTGLTPEQQELFLNFTANSKYSIHYRLLLATGMRIGESLALCQSDIDYENCTVSITKDVVFIKGERIVQTPKTEAAIRTIPLPASLCEELQQIETDILFPYSYNSVRIALEKTTEKLGFTVSAHILRHTYSDRLEEAGVPPKVKQYLIGHAKVDTTQNVYTEAQEHYVNKYADRIRNLF